jgi:hypothetical protein
MFTLYCDASGSPYDQNTAAFVVAGFVASAEQWIGFERNWNSVLVDYKVSAMHMKEFAHCAGEFAEWKGDEAKRRNFLSRLINVITTRMRHSFVNAIQMDAYRKVNQEFMLEESLKPYSIAAGSCVGKVKRWADKWGVPQDQIAYVFEEGDADKGDMMEKLKIGQNIIPLFLPKAKSVAFQAADLLAYEHLLAHKKLVKIADGKIPFSSFRYPFRELDKVPNGEHGMDWGVHDEKSLREACIRGNVLRRV